MPLFGYPYDDEEEKRRRFLTPGINGSLPEIAAPPRPTFAPPMGRPGSMPAPSYSPEDTAAAATPPTQGQRYQAEKQGYMRGTPGRGRSALSGALQGFLGGGGLIGAGMGALYGATDPRGLREQQFNQRRRPQILEQFGIEDAERLAQRQAQQDALNAQYRQAEIGNLQSEAGLHQAQANAAPINAQRQSEVSQSTIDLNNARAEAARRGTPQKVDLDEGGGKVGTYQVWPQGQMQRIGSSGAAAISTAGNKTRIQVAGMQQAGENARTNVREAGANARADTKPKPGSKGEATQADIDEAFKRAGGHAAGWTKKGMKKHFKDQGFRVPE